jgi:hypothetical protein
VSHNVVKMKPKVFGEEFQALGTWVPRHPAGFGDLGWVSRGYNSV